MYFFEDDNLTNGIDAGMFVDNWVSSGDSGYLQINNPSGYKYVSIPFDYYADISSETMTMTINREITGDEGKSYTEYLKESVIEPAVASEVAALSIPTKTSELTNDSGYLTSVPNEYITETELSTKGYLTEHQDISGKADLVEVARYITPEMYGAVGNGTTDDSAAIQAAIDAAGETATVYLSKKTYKITSTLEIHKSRIKFVCDGTISYAGTGAAIKMYGMVMSDIDIYGIQAPNGTALLMDSTDGELGNCIVSIKYIFSSIVGVHLKGDGATGATGHNIFYNKLHLEGCVTSTNTCIYIEPITALINENYFWVGRLYGGATYGIRVNATDTAGGNVVNGNASRNVFHGGNFEGIASDGYSIHIHNSSLNVFHDFRTEEAYGEYVLGLSGECYGNDIELSRIVLSEIDTSNLTSTGSYANILRSPQIAGATGDNLSGQNKIWLSMDGFSCETSNIMASLKTETWIFTLEDGTVIEKQVVAS